MIMRSLGMIRMLSFCDTEFWYYADDCSLCGRMNASSLMKGIGVMMLVMVTVMMMLIINIIIINLGTYCIIAMMVVRMMIVWMVMMMRRMMMLRSLIMIAIKMQAYCGMCHEYQYYVHDAD